MIPFALGLAPVSAPSTIDDITLPNKAQADGEFGLDFVGRGSFTVGYGTTFPADPKGRIVWDTFDGNRLGGWLVEKAVDTEVDDGGRARMVTTYSGRGLGSVLDRYRVLPPLGPDRSPSSRTRIFSAFSPAFDFSAWGAATAYVQVGDPDQPKAGFPEGFPEFDAWWIGPSEGDETQAPYGYWWTQKEFTVAEDTWTRTFFGLDDFGEVWLDGIPMSSVATDRDTLSGFTTAHEPNPVFLSAGTHRIGAKVINNFGAGDPGYGEGATVAGNPTMLALVMYASDQGGRLGDVLVVTDSTWKLLAYPDTPPGMTDPEALEVLLAEGIALGASPEVELVTSGTWPVRETITCRVGDSVLKHLGDRVDALALHWDFRWDTTWQLELIRPEDVGGAPSPPVAYTTGNRNLLHLESVWVDDGTDSLLVGYGEALFTLVPPEGGERTGYIETRIKAIGDAKVLGADLLAAPAQLERVTGEIQATSADDLPGLNPYPGQVVTVGGHVDELFWRWGFRYTEGLPGGLAWDIEIKDQIKRQEERTAAMLARAAGGQMGGTAPSAIGGDAPDLGTKIRPGELAFNVQKVEGGAYATGEAPMDKVPPANGNLYGVRITMKYLDVDASITVAYLVNGVDVLGGAGTVAYADPYWSVVIPVDPIVFLVANAGTSRVSIEILDVTGDSDGLTVEGLVV